MELGQLTTESTTVVGLSFLAFVVAMLLTPLYTFFAYRYKLWKPSDTLKAKGITNTVLAQLHAEKHQRNIPTMAGTILVISAAFITLLFNLDRQQTWLPLAALMGGGIVGLIDDIINIRANSPKLRRRRMFIKFAMITLFAAIAAWFFYYKLGYASVYVPLLGDVSLGWWLMPLFVAVVVCTVTSVNISDGLDGLAGGLLSTAYGVFGVIALLQGNVGIAGFCFTVVGVLLSYIWFNIYPARFFMGDVGSFALGTGLGVVAMLTDTLFLLPIIGLVFVLEAGSSLIQMLGKRLLGRRLFHSAPIHFHLQAKGWPETKVTMRFWVIGQVCGAIGLLLALSGGYIR